MSETIRVRVIFKASDHREEQVEEMDFPNVPRVGEALLVEEGLDGGLATFIVQDVGYLRTRGVALPCLQVAEFEAGEVPSGRYGPMIQDR